jgi:hypothetical protein
MDFAKMNPKQKEKLVISLIKDDLINLKLIYGLYDLGVDATEYYIHASDTVFELLGLNELPLTDTLCEYYIELTEKVKSIHIPNERLLLEKLAIEIYKKLLLKATN